MIKIIKINIYHCPINNYKYNEIIINKVNFKSICENNYIALTTYKNYVIWFQSYGIMYIRYE